MGSLRAFTGATRCIREGIIIQHEARLAHVELLGALAIPFSLRVPRRRDCERANMNDVVQTSRRHKLGVWYGGEASALRYLQRYRLKTACIHRKYTGNESTWVIIEEQYWDETRALFICVFNSEYEHLIGASYLR